MFQFNIQIHIEQMGIRLAPAYSKTQKSIEFEKKKTASNTHTYIISRQFIYLLAYSRRINSLFIANPMNTISIYHILLPIDKNRRRKKTRK